MLIVVLRPRCAGVLCSEKSPIGPAIILFRYSDCETIGILEADDDEHEDDSSNWNLGLNDPSPRKYRLEAYATFRTTISNPPTRRARQAVRIPDERYSLILLFRSASISRFSSSGVSFGRSIVSVSLLSLPVNLNGT